MSTQICSTCKQKLPTSEFYKSIERKQGIKAQCKQCYDKNRKDRYKTDEPYRKKLIQNSLDSKRKNQLGVSREQYKLLLESQNYCCAICQLLLDKSSKRASGHLDHCHTTGKVRGILCLHCNTGLGMFRDDTDTLLSAIQYLKY